MLMAIRFLKWVFFQWDRDNSKKNLKIGLKWPQKTSTKIPSNKLTVPRFQFPLKMNAFGFRESVHQKLPIQKTGSIRDKINIFITSFKKRYDLYPKLLICFFLKFCTFPGKSLSFRHSLYSCPWSCSMNPYYTPNFLQNRELSNRQKRSYLWI